MYCHAFFRSRKCRLILAWVLLVAAMPVGARSTEGREVKDPHFGEVLFYFYQQKYFSAIVHLQASQQLHRLSHHGDEAELLLGGLYLSYGLHQEAGRIFQALIDTGAAPPIRDRAWFYLAKIRYQRNYPAEAQEALARVRGVLPGELQAEREVLSAQLLMQQGRYAEAVRVLQGMHGHDGWAAYGRYNLGVALIKLDRTEAGVALLEAVGRHPAANEEMKALKDKANLALGYFFLQQEAPAKAKTYLEQVRLNGLLSNQALLGFGWASSVQGQHEQSLVPWEEMQKRDVIDAAVQESLLAVPYALSQLGAYRQSLQHYEKAIVLYNQEIDRLAASIEAIRAGKMVEHFLQRDPIDEMGWFWRVQELPDAPESRYLVHLLAGHDFQEALKNYRDLRFLARNLDDWLNNIHIYDDMLVTRRKAYAERLPKALHASAAADLARRQAQRDRYAGELVQIEKTEDASALATAEQRQQREKLQRVEQQLARLPDDASRREMQAKQRLLRGLLEWDLTAEYHPRLWNAKKALKELDHAVAESDARRVALLGAQKNAPKTFEGFGERIRTLRARIAQRQSQTVVLTREQQRYLQELAVAELDRQRQRLATYVIQARFAVAQIYDQATNSGEEGK